MKKTLVLFLIVIGSIFANASFSSAGFLDDDGSLDLYKKIDEGAKDYTKKMTEMELKGGKADGTISDFVNKNLKTDCVDLNIDSIYSEDLKTLLGNCLNKDGKNIAKVNEYYNKIQALKTQSERLARDKIKNLYSISRIGLYTDGNDDNSPFDLMTDLANINKVIFSEDIPYDGINNMDASSGLDAFLNGKLGDDLVTAMRGNLNNNLNNLNPSSTNNQNGAGNQTNDSNYICKTDESGLNTNQLESIRNNYKVSDFNNYARTNQLTQNPKDWINSNPVYASGNITNGGYTSINDNNLWPCNNFFCITVEFVTTMHNLLTGGKTVSIESLINRSNNHLKKFTNTSLIQARMTTNNFQIGLKDLNLGDIFHIGFQVIKKAPPILNIEGGKEKEPKTDIDGKDSKTMLASYFKNLGLDYKRQNDLNIFMQQESELKSIMSSTENKISESLNKNQDYIDLTEQKKKINASFSNQVTSSALSKDSLDFSNQFLELERFTSFLQDTYATSLRETINSMNNKTTGSK